ERDTRNGPARVSTTGIRAAARRCRSLGPMSKGRGGQRRQQPAFPASGPAGGCSRIVTMWRPNEPADEDVSDPSGFDPGSKRRRSRRQASRDGLADQSVIKALENVRSYQAFERSVIGSVDPRSVLELALARRLASLLWRLRRASAIETGLFEIQSELLLTHRQDP